MPRCSTPVLALQLLFLACSYMPGVSQPAKGAMMLISLWFFGLNVGIALGRKYLERGDE